MAGKRHLDPDSDAAIELIQMEQQKEEIARLEQKKREKLIAETYQLIGRIQSMNMMEKLATVSSLLWLKQVKEMKLYRDLPEFGSWDSFCNYVGFSRRHVDEQLQNLKILGQEFLETVSTFKVGYRELRMLRYVAQEGDLIIDTEAVTIGEEKIPLTPDHAEDLEAAIQGLLESKNKKIDEHLATLKAKDRIIKSKDEVINKQEQEISRHERDLKERDFAPGEEAFLKQLAAIQAVITGNFYKLDPEEIDLAEATPRMIASYIELTGFVSRWAVAIHDTARNNHGNDKVDGGWIQSPADGEKTICDHCKDAHPECFKCCNLCLVPCTLKQTCKFTKE